MAKNFFDQHIVRSSLGHLYFIQDSIPIPELLTFLEDETHEIINEQYETFTIAHSRELKERQSQKSFSGGKRIFILSLLTFGHEAAQALLKVFEEPSEGVHFFVYLPEPEKLPDTLKSRGQSIFGIQGSISEECTLFITNTIKERLIYIQKKIASFEDTETSAPLRAWAVSFVKELGIVLHPHIQKYVATMTILEEARGYLHDRSASVKLLLEHIALIYPKKDVL